MDDYLYNDADFLDESFVWFGTKYSKRVSVKGKEYRKLIREGWKPLYFTCWVSYPDTFSATLGLPAAIHA